MKPSNTPRPSSRLKTSLYRAIMALCLAPMVMVLAVGCGADKDCVELCEESQSGNCTDVKGSCSAFCGALDDVEAAANCTSQRDSYAECLNSEDNVCDTGCDSNETAMFACYTNYCLSNNNNASCQTLVAAF